VIRQLPVIPTILVVLAAAIMVSLGVWQLGRSYEKEAMIARFSAIPADAPTVPLEVQGADWEDQYLYRRVAFDCGTPQGMRGTAGDSHRGAKGWHHVAKCALPDGEAVEVVLGWSIDPQPPEWSGGEVIGMMGPGKKVVADPVLGGLILAAKPDPNDLPNNHLVYAGQWFFFALTALLIYGFAIRSRLSKRD